MFRVLGHFATRYWPAILIGWVGLLVAIFLTTPRFSDVVQDGEFRFIPDTGRLWPWEDKRKFSSREGENLFKNSFSRDLLGSSVVLVLRRESHPDGLLEKDRRFIRNILLPRLEKIRQSEDAPVESGKSEPVIIRIRTLDDDGIGELLVSEDGKATLVILELRTEFLETRNRSVLEKVEGLISRDGELRNPSGGRESHLNAAGVGATATLTLQTNEGIPVGLDISLSGTATVGRDMRLAQEQSADNTHLATLVLVFVLLLLIYRSPLLVLVPMLTVVVSVTIALQSLAFLASMGEVELFWGLTFHVQLFAGVEIYVQVVMYGAGIDYCMFLMARYKEEHDAGASFADAVSAAVGKVGPALAASAGTTMAGIGMMVFAQFGKFQQAGVAMSFSLLFVLAASLTFTPALLRLFGRWAFWPQMRSEQLPQAGGWVSPTRLVDRLIQSGVFRGVWEKIGHKLRERPGAIWLACVAVMMPFAVIALLNHGFLSFGLLSELPAEAPSVVGTRAVQRHFPAGATGPVTILLKSRELQFKKDGVATDDGLQFIRTVTEELQQRREDLGIADIRSLVKPFGISKAARRAELKWNAELERVGVPERMARNRRRHDEELSHYVSDKGELAGYVTRIDVVFEVDPFSRNMIDQLEEMKRVVRDLLPEERRDDLFVIGSTASISDLKTVTGQDQVRINVLVVLAVFAVLVMLLRRPAISAYLILSVFFSYLVTLGATFALFYLMDPSGFSGLDWKVPVFLFTILIAVGEDYNIYLVTRIDEEQARHGPLDGITAALTKTGSIISGCGIIMAGTFSSLLFGTLTGMHQLGFALAFGVLLDTFVVRPILVPAYLVLLHSGRFGVLGRILGAGTSAPGGQRPPWKTGSDAPKRES